MKLSNISRSLSEIAPQASLFIPTSIPSAPLPSYVMVDPGSPWHVSGLLSAAIESMSLPSRLKIKNGSRQTMDGLINALNINGSQTIAKLRMSVDHTTALNSHYGQGRLSAPTESKDLRVPSQDRSIQADLDADLATFDMDFFPAETGEQPKGRRSSNVPHVFGQAEYYRVGESNDSNGSNEKDEGYERARRRAAGLPLIQKLVHTSSSDHRCKGGYYRYYYPRIEHIVTPFQVFSFLDSCW
jgi:hypothetical protein